MQGQPDLDRNRFLISREQSVFLIKKKFPHCSVVKSSMLMTFRHSLVDFSFPVYGIRI